MLNAPAACNQFLQSFISYRAVMPSPLPILIRPAAFRPLHTANLALSKYEAINSVYTLDPNPDIEKIDITNHEDLERFFLK